MGEGRGGARLRRRVMPGYEQRMVGCGVRFHQLRRYRHLRPGPIPDSCTATNDGLLNLRRGRIQRFADLLDDETVAGTPVRGATNI